jgi:P-type Ca2+ transporter type 2C
MDAPLADITAGLDEPEAALRFARYGPNRLSEDRTRNMAGLALEALREPMFLLLFAAVALYFAIGDRIEAAFLLVSASGAIGLSVAQAARSERALAALRRLAEPTVRVIREGQERRIAAADLVPGDLFLIGEGGRIPADAVLLAGDVLSVDESVLTGESSPVERQPDRAQRQDDAGQRLFAGTLVVRGQGVARATHTGAATRIGGIGASLAAIGEAPSPLQRTSRKVVTSLGLFAMAVAAGVLITHGLVRGDWIAGALASLTIGIALIPEEFPMVLAVFLALGAWRMAGHQVLTRRSAAIETLGAVSVLCVDKTGTLTENRMRVVELWRDGQAWDARGGAPGEAAAQRLLSAAALASAPRPTDPMDRALRALAPSDGEAAPLRSYPLRPERLAFIQAWPEPGGGVRLAAKGAPEAIFDLCSLDPPARAGLDIVVSGLATRGLRVLGVASLGCEAAPDTPPNRFTFEGLVSFEDPVRAEVPAALALARDAGIRVVMITGDYPATGLAIAGQAGIAHNGLVLGGAEMRGLSAEALRARVRTVQVFARIAPDQKLALVEALKAEGEIVAMFGDGVNDAPALEAAHVGVAMGLRGTDVAREAADLVLLDDRFASVVAGVAEGRRIFANLRAALAYVVAVHIPIAGLALAPVVMGLGPILFPLQVVLLELVIDPMCAVVFEGRRADRDAMSRPPRSAGDPLFGWPRITVSVLQGLGVLASVFGLHLLLLSRGVPEPAARAATLVGLVSANLALAAVIGAARGRAPGRRQLAVYGLIAGLVTLLMGAAVSQPWLARLFQFAPPDPWITAQALAAGVGSGLFVGLAARTLDAGPPAHRSQSRPLRRRAGD